MGPLSFSPRCPVKPSPQEAGPSQQRPINRRPWAFWGCQSFRGRPRPPAEPPGSLDVLGGSLHQPGINPRNPTSPRAGLPAREKPPEFLFLPTLWTELDGEPLLEKGGLANGCFPAPSHTVLGPAPVSPGGGDGLQTSPAGSRLHSELAPALHTGDRETGPSACTGVSPLLPCSAPSREQASPRAQASLAVPPGCYRPVSLPPMPSGSMHLRPLPCTAQLIGRSRHPGLWGTN